MKRFRRAHSKYKLYINNFSFSEIKSSEEMTSPNNTNIFVLYIVLIPLFVSIMTLFYVFIIEFLRTKEKQNSSLVSDEQVV